MDAPDLPPRKAAGGAVLLFSFALLLPLGFFSCCRYWGKVIPMTQMLLWLLFFPALALTVFAVSLKHFGLTRRDILGAWKLEKRDLLWILGTFFVMSAWITAVSLLWQMLLRALNIPFTTQQPLLAAVRSFSSGQLILLFLSTAAVTPVVEELLFRRLIFSVLKPWGTCTAWFHTAFFFSICHNFLAGIPGLVIMGLGFQFVYWKSGKLSAAMLLHFLVNSSALLAAAFFPGVP